MPKWKKDETDFTVSLGYNDVKGYWVTVPKPIVQFLGEPERITFEVRGKRVQVEASNNMQNVSKNQRSI